MLQQQHKIQCKKEIKGKVYNNMNNLGSCKGVIILGYSKYINY